MSPSTQAVLEDFLQDFFLIRVLANPFTLNGKLTLDQSIPRSLLTSSTCGDQAQLSQPMLEDLREPAWMGAQLQF